MDPYGEVKDFLKSTNLCSLLEGKAHGLATVNKWTLISAATEVLAKHNILSVAVLDEETEYFGCLSVNDLLRNIYSSLQSKDPEWTEHIDQLTADDLLALGQAYGQQTVEKLQHAGDLWLLNADSTSSVLDAVLESFHVQDAVVHHRLFVCTPMREPASSNTQANATVINIRPGSERRAATGWRVNGVVSHSDVVKLLWEHKEVFGEIGDHTVDDLELTAGAVFTVPGDMPALEAFGFMARDHKSSMGLTDGKKLVGNLSVSDLRGLKAEEFPLLLLSAAEFALVVHGKGATKEEALAGKRIQDAVKQLPSLLPVVVVTPESTLIQVLETLVTRHLHRVYVIEESGEPLSIITLTDVLRAVTRAPPPLRPRVSQELRSDPEDDEDEDDDDDDEDVEQPATNGPAAP